MRNALLPVFLCLLPISGCALPAAGGHSGRISAPGRSAPVAQLERTVPTQLQYFVRSWRVAAREPNKSEVMTIAYKAEPAIGGKWLAGTGESSDLTVRARDSWGIDPASGEILRFVFDSSGAYGIVRSRGWEGDRLVLEGEAQSRGGPTKVRETITRVGPDQFHAVWEALQDGSWKAYSIKQVTRQ